MTTTTTATTIYTFHDARNAAILATADAANLQIAAQRVARAISTYSTQRGSPTRRAFVHNGLGVISAGLCRDGIWHDILRDDFLRMADAAAAARKAEGLPTT